MAKSKAFYGCRKAKISSQTCIHPDIPYQITGPLLPIFTMQLCHKTPRIKYLSRSLARLNSILWCPADDEIGDAADEYLAEQYYDEIREKYSEAHEQARLKHEEDQHGYDEHHAVIS